MIWADWPACTGSDGSASAEIVFVAITTRRDSTEIADLVVGAPCRRSEGTYMFTNLKARAVWLATVGTLVFCSFRTAAGDELTSAQQPQPIVGHSANLRHSSASRESSEGDGNSHNPWIIHELSDDCKCISCRSRRTWFSRNNECLFHWYIPSRQKSADRNSRSPWIVHELTDNCKCTTCLSRRSWFSRNTQSYVPSRQNSTGLWPW